MSARLQPTAAPPLRFLDFDLSEDTDGLRAWSALAWPAPEHHQALLDEVAALLHDLGQHLGVAGPVDEGHPWDHALDIQSEPDASGRCALSLHLTGGPALADRLTLWIGQGQAEF